MPRGHRVVAAFPGEAQARVALLTAHRCRQVPQLLSAMGSLWSLWFGSSVLSVLEVLELLLDAMVLTLLLCCRQLHRARGQLGAAPGEPTPSQRPTCCPAAAGMTSNARGPSWPRFP